MTINETILLKISDVLTADRFIKMNIKTLLRKPELKIMQTGDLRAKASELLLNVTNQELTACFDLLSSLAILDVDLASFTKITQNRVILLSSEGQRSAASRYRCRVFET